MRLGGVDGCLGACQSTFKNKYNASKDVLFSDSNLQYKGTDLQSLLIDIYDLS